MTTEAEALLALRGMVAAGHEPALTDIELRRHLLAARRADVDGLWPSDTGWDPTYDLNAAAASAWRDKAAQLAGAHSFETGAGSFSRSDLIDHALRMAQLYTRRQGPVSIALTGRGIAPTELLP